MKLHLRATVCHLPYGIRQCYLLPDTSERRLPALTPARQASSTTVIRPGTNSNAIKPTETARTEIYTAINAAVDTDRDTVLTAIFLINLG